MGKLWKVLSGLLAMALVLSLGPQVGVVKTAAAAGAYDDDDDYDYDEYDNDNDNEDQYGEDQSSDDEDTDDEDSVAEDEQSEVSPEDLVIDDLEVTADYAVVNGFKYVGFVGLDWTETEDAEGYLIYRRAAGQKWQVIDQVAGDSDWDDEDDDDYDDDDEDDDDDDAMDSYTYCDTTVAKGTVYAYAVVAYARAEGGRLVTGGYSNICAVSVSGRLKKPVIKATKSGKKIKVTFKVAEGNRYEVQCKIGKKGWKKLDAGSLKKIISKKGNKKITKVRVRTIGKIGKKTVTSDWSSAVKVAK